MASCSKLLIQLLVCILCPFFQVCAASFLVSRGTSRQIKISPFHFRVSANDDQNDPVLRLPLLESELSTMSPCDDEVSERRRQELQSSVENARTAAEFGVRRAQVNFYEAFSNGDVSAMESVWSDKGLVRCVHPGMSALEGKDEVMKSWAQIFSQGELFNIEPSRVHVEVCGMSAIVSCIEETPNGGKLEALNIYRREGGAWRMTLHMASPVILQQR
uniref:SnoaL-like domain-containing protein n=2 Tax=Odontella aurita TaxID=265563 RepID=A0A7S4IF26_9STRA|mmetsp:Transcript_24189/g.71212  ORF Transcript_24189/g.71212 Transcript_24189/m.71212 type:complete len:217 (+) Transcript_24189:126-776(+)|eukprot:CAMPEP_0113532506 /NCGR_PEP_ID=MMETSP0015_2-20120614/4097_1 /TAXON_ID=2838 /ORGANISM="Odontella" /LENGTH=216 /DNA_ID=CAMNT_0000431475 /DNA_START=83 /DNA_END=733 /DNA_ORIENTATION=+ /assembly_acc=CAM_ASM_000160